MSAVSLPRPMDSAFTLKDLTRLMGRRIKVTLRTSRPDPFDAARCHLDIKDAIVKGVGLLGENKMLMVEFFTRRIEDEMTPGGLAQLVGPHEKAMCLVTRAGEPIPGHDAMAYSDGFTPVEITFITDDIIDGI